MMFFDNAYVIFYQYGIPKSFLGRFYFTFSHVVGFNAILKPKAFFPRTSSSWKDILGPSRNWRRFDKQMNFKFHFWKKCISSKRYVVFTYYLPVDVFHVFDTYFLRISPMYWPK